MPKIKTNKAAAKRITKKTASGKLMRGRSNRSHNTAKRSSKRMRQLRDTVAVKGKGAQDKLQRLVPYL